MLSAQHKIIKRALPRITEISKRYPNLRDKDDAYISELSNREYYGRGNLLHAIILYIDSLEDGGYKFLECNKNVRYRLEDMFLPFLRVRNNGFLSYQDQNGKSVSQLLFSDRCKKINPKVKRLIYMLFLSAGANIFKLKFCDEAKHNIKSLLLFKTKILESDFFMQVVLAQACGKRCKNIKEFQEVGKNLYYFLFCSNATKNFIGGLTTITHQNILHIAIRDANFFVDPNFVLSVITWIPKIGIDINAIDYFNSTVLHVAARYTNNPQCVALLLDAGASLRAKNLYQHTALKIAHECSNKETLKVMLAYSTKTLAKNVAELCEIDCVSKCTEDLVMTPEFEEKEKGNRSARLKRTNTI